MIKEIKLTKEFIAYRADGSPVNLRVFTEYIDVSTMNSVGPEKIEGLKSIEDENGNSVNRISKGKYKTLFTHEILSSDAPDAP